MPNELDTELGFCLRGEALTFYEQALHLKANSGFRVGDVVNRTYHGIYNGNPGIVIEKSPTTKLPMRYRVVNIMDNGMVVGVLLTGSAKEGKPTLINWNRGLVIDPEYLGTVILDQPETFDPRANKREVMRRLKEIRTHNATLLWDNADIAALNEKLKAMKPGDHLWAISSARKDLENMSEYIVKQVDIVAANATKKYFNYEPSGLSVLCVRYSISEVAVVQTTGVKYGGTNKHFITSGTIYTDKKPTTLEDTLG